MDGLVWVSQAGLQAGSQHQVTLWRSFQEELGHCRQSRQPHLNVLIHKVLCHWLQQIRSILQKEMLQSKDITELPV